MFFVLGAAGLAVGEVMGEVVDGAVGDAVVHAEGVGGVAVGGVDEEGEGEETFEGGFAGGCGRFVV